MKIKAKVWLEKDGKLVFGLGKQRILEAVAETNSINKAAKKLNMSYRHTWSYIHSAEKRLGNLLLLKVRGGKEGGGAVLTDYAKELLKKFEKVEKKVMVFTDKCYKETFKEK
ncbi:MAG: LysR family transcriptional regulator [Candidatus Firestonebacteria bacterium]